MLTFKQKTQKLLTPQKNLTHQNLVEIVVSQTKLLKNQLTMVGLSRYQQAHLKLQSMIRSKCPKYSHFLNLEQLLSRKTMAQADHSRSMRLILETQTMELAY
ncbi:Hypothetical_protein [Hexamita inflata]|uniref:Hypothetical_protein n=1 Tax=Hexamita inflata TaxID=28002 RepID=A0AA86NI44_9EUKA|nr:Hypothetical protein HINF_LOCUS7084 [Hexamita inflata]